MKDEIPLSARIFAVVDVWDALLSKRPYREPCSQEETVDYINDETGELFDPVVVDAFFQIIESDPIFTEEYTTNNNGNGWGVPN